MNRTTRPIPDYKFIWRGIDFREVSHIQGAPGRAPTVYFRDARDPVTLRHYPGAGTFQRAEGFLRFSIWEEATTNGEDR